MATAYLTEVKLIAGISFDNSYQNVMDFNSVGARDAYFNSKVLTSATNLAFQREQMFVRYPANSMDIVQATYLSFTNTAYSNKTFYAFINRIEYVNDETSHIYFTIDFWQTYQFNVTIKEAFVEREHPDTDEIGENLVPENFELGQLKYESLGNFTELIPLAIIVSTAVDKNGEPVEGSIQGKIYQGCAYYAWHSSNVSSLNAFLKKLNTDGKAMAVQSIFMCPEYILGNFTDGEKLNQPDLAIKDKIVLHNTNSIDGYVPKNNKLFTYPYDCLYVTNYQGNSAEYRWEAFLAGQGSFTAMSNVSPGACVNLVPHQYNNVLINYDEQLTLQGYPLCSWLYAGYQNWQAQNAFSNLWSYAKSFIPLAVAVGTTVATGGAGGAIAGAAVSGFTSLADQFAGASVREAQPPQAMGTQATANTNLSAGQMTFGFFRKTVRKEFAEIIDSIWTVQGYAIRRTKVPNIKGRPRFNYVKCLNAIVTGSCPAPALQTITNMLNNGVTFWHDDTIGDYSSPNK